MGDWQGQLNSIRKMVPNFKVSLQIFLMLDLRTYICELCYNYKNMFDSTVSRMLIEEIFTIRRSDNLNSGTINDDW